jgi:hypothetical protein
MNGNNYLKWNVSLYTLIVVILSVLLLYWIACKRPAKLMINRISVSIGGCVQDFGKFSLTAESDVSTLLQLANPPAIGKVAMLGSA